MSKGFMKAGHLPTLFAAFLYFDLSFMVWVLLGPLGVAIARELHLDPAHKGLMVATPVLAGAVLRLPLGFWWIASAPSGPAPAPRWWSSPA